MARPATPERREEVLDEVVAYLARHGLAGFSTRKLADALGFSTNVIFYQFTSREGLILAALARARTENLRMLTDLRERAPSTTVSQAFVAIWAWWMGDPVRLAYSRLNMEAMMEETSIDPAKRRELLEYWSVYFSDWLVRDGHDRRTARELVTLMLAAQSGLTIDLISTGDRERLDAAVVRFATLLEVPR